MTKNRKYGFSLIEAMLSLVILSVVLVMTASLITKKIDFKSHEGVIYTYQAPNATQNCYVLNQTADGYETTKDCTEYVFEVPKGVSKVNLTLVAGGGGGAGGYLPRTLKGTNRLNTVLYKAIQDETPELASVLPEHLAGIRELTIDYMTGTGEASDLGNVASCLDSGETLCSDSGKKSSSAIMNFKFDSDTLNKIGKTDQLKRSKVNGDNKNLGEFEVDFSDGASLEANFNYNGISSANNISCVVPNVSDISLPSCTFNVTIPSASSTSLTLIPGYNSFAGKQGQPVYDYTLSKVVKGRIIQGGIGGQIPNMLNNAQGIAYGSGANGRQKELTCTTPGVSECDKANAGITVKTSTKPEGKGYVQMSYNADLISDIIPSGGAGGAMLRTLDFPVTPGDKYVIRVGKGGKGGLGSVSEGAADTKEASTGWENAKGGVTTAIYKLDGTTETLVYLVNGGMQGRMVNQPSYTIPSVFSSSSTYIDLIKPDKTFNSLDNSGDDYLADDEAFISPDNSFVSSKIIYPFLSQDGYKRLNSHKDGENYTSGAILRAFSAFPEIFTGTGSAVEEKDNNELQGSDIQINDTKTIEKVYDGFFPRRIINDRYAYIGGLGGFSGLGSKAGCGGFFNGNADSRRTDDILIGSISAADSLLVKNKFVTGNTLYNVNEFYEGCSDDTPNGHSAKFIMPDFKKHLLGSAGAGGGAGGYSILTGTGNGGDGQNGYVMIEWRR